MDCRQFLEALSASPGVSGYETSAADIVEEAFRAHCDGVRRDPLGNVIGSRRSPGYSDGPRVMLAAHMDEIGLVITKHEKGGFLRFSTIGGFDQRTLVGQEVTVHGTRPLNGVIGAKPPHLSTPAERRKSIPIADLYIDLGLNEDEAKAGVSVGDIATLRRNFTRLGKSFVSGKAMDDRAGVAAVLEALRALDKLNFNAEVYAVATVQEEVGVRGAFVSSYSLNPDIGIAIDVCHGEMPGVPEDRGHALDKGPVLDIGPHVHPKVLKKLKEAAEEFGIPYGIAASPSPSGTDAYALQMARGGVPTALISLPLRYMHTSVETLSMGDIAKAGKLMAAFISSIDSCFVEGLKCF